MRTKSTNTKLRKFDVLPRDGVYTLYGRIDGSDNDTFIKCSELDLNERFPKVHKELIANWKEQMDTNPIVQKFTKFIMIDPNGTIHNVYMTPSSIH